MKIFISHSVGCAQWDMPAIYRGTSFQNACRTTRYREPDRGIVKMLDWDYRAFQKDPAGMKQKHLDVVRGGPGIEVIMSMDLWPHNISEALAYADELRAAAPRARVLIPAHCYPPELLGRDIALPNANWFARNVPCPPAFAPFVKHILGGSPHSQLHHARRFPNLESVDGNQIFNAAIRFGKTWVPYKPYWLKHNVVNERAFRMSIKNVQWAWDRHEGHEWRSLMDFTPLIFNRSKQLPAEPWVPGRGSGEQ